MQITAFKILPWVFISFLITGCTHFPQTEHVEPQATEKTQVSSTNEDEQQNQLIEIESPVTHNAQKDLVTIGTGQFTSTQLKSKHVAKSKDGDISLNFQGVDLNAFLKVVLGDVLALNYSVDDEVTGKVTIQTSTPITPEELLPITESILDMNDAALLVDGNFYRVVPKQKALKGQLSPSLQLAKNGQSMQVVPLKYIAAAEMNKILLPMTNDNTIVQTDIKRNLLIISASKDELDNMMAMVQLFDVDWIKGMSVGLFTLQNSKSPIVKTELDTILTSFQESDETGLLNGLVRIVSIERMNAILVVSPNEQALQEVHTWITRLDLGNDQSKQRLYVYKVQNAKAVELAQVLGLIFNTESVATTSSVNERDSQLQTATAPSTTQIELAGGTAQALAKKANTSLNKLSGKTDNTVPSIDIIADDVRNALVIRSTASDYEMIVDTIKQLDTVPLQVLIEASIIEVSLSDELNFGVEWFFKNGIGNKTGQGSLDLGDKGIGALSPSFAFTVVDSASNVRLALNALAAKSDINVLSSPSIMVLDNRTAKINVGDEIPVPTRQSVSNTTATAPTVNEIEFRSTGVTLTVTPRVNDSGLVTMELRQEVSNAVKTTSSSLDAPTIQQRAIDSVVAINSGETIVLGGLIQDSQTKNHSGIPGLYELPILGHLFGEKSNDKRRTELLVLITPRVVRDKTGARQITDEFRTKLRGIEAVEMFNQASQQQVKP